MEQLAENVRTRELSVQLTGRDGSARSSSFLITPEGEENQVPAGELKQGLLDVFGEGSAVMEADALTDENRSYHLMGFDGAGQGTTFTDGEKVDLDRYNRFEITPRTTGGQVHVL
jgi:hypothetical protein